MTTIWKQETTLFKTYRIFECNSDCFRRQGRKLPNVLTYQSAGSLARVPARPQAQWAPAPMEKWHLSKNHGFEQAAGSLARCANWFVPMLIIRRSRVCPQSHHVPSFHMPFPLAPLTWPLSCALAAVPLPWPLRASMFGDVFQNHATPASSCSQCCC